MLKLIDQNKVYPLACASSTRHGEKLGECSYDEPCERLVFAFTVAEPVDAAPVVHGQWRYYSTTMQECSICHRHTARHKFKYCPHCGAIMEDRYNDG